MENKNERGRKVLIGALAWILAVLATVGLIVIKLLLSWIIVSFFVKMIFHCFDLTFSLKIATGVWLTIILIRTSLNTNTNNKDGGDKNE